VNVSCAGNETLFKILFTYNLSSQDTLVLNQIGQSYISKLIGSRYFKLESENITLQEIKSLKNRLIDHSKV
jgi:hypothetical protein